MTKSKSVEEVRKRREDNAPKLFNMTLALSTISATPVKASRSGATGEMTNNLLGMFTAAGTPLAINQLTAALKANGVTVVDKNGKDITSKTVSDKVWTLSSANKNNKAPLLKKGMVKGTYELA